MFLSFSFQPISFNYYQYDCIFFKILETNLDDNPLKSQKILPLLRNNALKPFTLELNLNKYKITKNGHTTG